MILSLILALLLGQNQVTPVKLSEGGFCAGLSWIDVGADGEVVAELGPDFTVYRYRGPGEAWGVYSGGYAQGGDGPGKTLFARDGVTVSEIRQDGQFAGYLAQQDKGYWQNHFFGAAFKGNQGDLAFFRRVHFGGADKQKCERHPVQ